jgi:hypothetical protein
MPVTINQVESQIEVESPDSSGEAPRTEASAQALQRWQELARREARLSARTAAWGFDD